MRLIDNERMKHNMFEFALAWIFLFIGIVTQTPTYFIASGVFAVAGQVEKLRKGDK